MVIDLLGKLDRLIRPLRRHKSSINGLSDTYIRLSAILFIAILFLVISNKMFIEDFDLVRRNLLSEAHYALFTIRGLVIRLCLG